jgi:cytidine deaminase
MKNMFVEKLNAIVDDSSFRGKVSKEVIQTIVGQTGMSLDDIQLELLPFAAKFAEPLISNFRVGAVARGSSGHFYFGMNLEFNGLPLIYSVHAEQASILNARFFGESEIESIAASATPCGICRQFMNEMANADQLRIFLPGNNTVHRLPHYLPDSFGPTNLKLKCHLLQPQNHQMQLAALSDDPAILAALEAANRSYAPYTKSYSGIAVVLNNGEIFTGSYVENAAFNPSFPPLGMALIHLNFAKQSYQNIKKVILVEAASSIATQKDLTQNMLQSISPAAVFCHYKAI